MQSLLDWLNARAGTDFTFWELAQAFGIVVALGAVGGLIEGTVSIIKERRKARATATNAGPIPRAIWRPSLIWADRTAIFLYLIFVGGLWLLADRFSVIVFWVGLKFVVPLWLVLRGIDWVVQGRIR